jgi:hypothetical protein
MNLKYNFLLVSRRDGDATKIITEIERNKLYSVKLIETASDTIKRLHAGNIHCLAFNFENFNGQKLKMITDLRDLGYYFPVIVFAAFIDPSSLALTRKLNKVVVIEKPFEAKDVWGICQKLLQGRKVNQRIFRRYYTNQTAALERISGETHAGGLFNLSRGGAYIEVESSAGFRPGEFLKLTVHLSELSKAYNVDAEVVWATENGYASGKPAVGLRFVKSHDVYRNLLHKL